MRKGTLESGITIFCQTHNSPLKYLEAIHLPYSLLFWELEHTNPRLNRLIECLPPNPLGHFYRGPKHPYLVFTDELLNKAHSRLMAFQLSSGTPIRDN